MIAQRIRLFAYVLLISGVALLTWFGEQWYRLPVWTEGEIEQSVELNLAMDLQRLGPNLRPEGEKLARLRQMVRAEVEAEIRKDREQVERWLGLGLICLVFGASQLILQRGLQRGRS